MLNPTWFYAGALYAIGIALARKRGIGLPRRVAIFFYALVLAFLWAPLTQDATNLPVDFLRTLPPWAYLTNDHVALNNQTNDIPLQIVPWAHQVRESWKSLTPPLWNNYSACGYPLLASMQSSALSPLRLLGLPLNLAHAMSFEAAMKLLLALTFMFLWCRRRGYSEIASVTGAVAFALSMFLLVWLHFPIVTTACFIPAVFYLIDLLAERRTFARFTSLAAVGTLMLFGGHPETVAHTFFLAVLYVGWIVLVERSAPNARTFLLALVGALAVSALLAAPLLAPFLESLPKSKRFYDLERRPLTSEVPFSDWASAKLLVQPMFYGPMPKETWGPAHAESITGFAGTLGIAAWFALLAHVIRRRAWRSREMFFVLATMLVVGVILSWPGVSELFHVVFRLAANARLRLFLALLLAMQTAAAVDLFERDRRSLFLGLGAAAALLAIVFFSSDFLKPEHRQHALVATLTGVAVLAVAAIVAAVPKRRDVAILFVLVAVTAELWNSGHAWNPTISNEWMYPKTPMLKALDDLAAKVPENEPFRIVANGPAFFPNVSAVYGYEDVRAHDPMANGRYIDLLALIIQYDKENYFPTWEEWDKRLLNFLNVRYILTTKGGELATPRYTLLYDGPDGRIYENPEVLPRFYAARNVILEFRDQEFDRRLRELEGWSHTALIDRLELESEQQRADFFAPRPDDAPVATTEILRAKPTDYRLHIKAPRYTLIASSVAWWPGWKVERNGARIEPIRVNRAFIGFAVPAGESEVRVWYDPWTWRFGVILSLATLVALIAYRYRSRYRTR